MGSSWDVETDPLSKQQVMGPRHTKIRKEPTWGLKHVAASNSFESY
jgi:hypothetical protein